MSDTPGVEMKGSQARQDALAVMVGDTGFTMAGLAEVFVQSGFFKDVKGQAQAIVKVLYGRELGMSPLQAMIAINMVEGRPEVASATLGAIIKRQGKYDYRVKELDATKCAIEFFEGKAETGVSIGVARFTVEDATRAGLAKKFNYTAYPEDMMFSRAMSRGVKRFCLDAVGGVPVYSEGEIREARDARVAAGEVIEAGADDVAEVNPFASAKKPEAPAVALDPAGPAEPKRGRPRKVVSVPPPELVDPVCTLVREDGVRCTGPTGHDGACIYPDAPVVVGSEDCEVEGCWAGRNHEGDHVFEGGAVVQEVAGEAGHAATAAPASPVQGADAPPPPPDIKLLAGATEFTLFGKFYRTAGMTSAQMAESYELADQADKSALGKGYARGLLAKLMHVPVQEATRLKLTEEAAERYLKALRQAAAAPTQAELEL
jgi:hypothetical protein